MWSLTGIVLVCAGMGYQDPDQDLVVHEWGTFTSVTGGSGAALEWRPLAGASDLPSFVYQIGEAPKGLRHGPTCVGCRHQSCTCGADCAPNSAGECNNCKTCITATVRMETPVIYFYTKREQVVSVAVDFPLGRITEWYPQAREVGKGIVWGGVKLLPDARPDYPREAADSHYYPARETDAVPVRVCGNGGPQVEKFLFYRGVATFPLSVRAVLDGDAVLLSHDPALRGKEWAPEAFLIECRDGKVSIGNTCCFPTSEQKRVPRTKPTLSIDEACREMERVLKHNRLYEREARAMVRTWRDTWFEDGLRVFYVLPTAETNALLPLKIAPPPTELVRVLVGRIEILTPEFEARIRSLAGRLDADSIDEREKATRQLRDIGRFAEPVLRRIAAESGDEELRTRIAEIVQ